MNRLQRKTNKQIKIIINFILILNNVSLNEVSRFYKVPMVVIINENLTWKNHIDVISKTISRNFGMLTKMEVGT